MQVLMKYIDTGKSGVECNKDKKDIKKNMRRKVY